MSLENLELEEDKSVDTLFGLVFGFESSDCKNKKKRKVDWFI